MHGVFLCVSHVGGPGECRVDSVPAAAKDITAIRGCGLRNPHTRLATIPMRLF